MSDKNIKVIDDFVDAVIQLSGEQKDWDTSKFMSRIQLIILKSIRTNEEINGKIAIAYFRLYSLLPKKSSRDRIRSTVLAIREWLTD